MKEEKSPMLQCKKVEKARVQKKEAKQQLRRKLKLFSFNSN